MAFGLGSEQNKGYALRKTKPPVNVPMLRTQTGLLSAGRVCGKQVVCEDVVVRVKITETTEVVGRLLFAICSRVVFREDEIEQLCLRLEIDPFQLRQLFERSLEPAADIPVENDVMPPAWYDNNVQLGRLLLELNDVLEFSKSEWQGVLEQTGISETEVADLFRTVECHLTESARKYAV